MNDSETPIAVRIRGFEIRDNAARYKIYVTLRDSTGETREVTGAQQRWSKILSFETSLKKLYSSKNGYSFSLPVVNRPKRFLMKSKFDVTHLEQRAKSLDEWLKALLDVVELRESDELISFLSTEIKDDKKGNGGAGGDTEEYNDAARTVLADQPFVDAQVKASQTEEISIHVSSEDVTVVYEFISSPKDIGLTVNFRADAGTATTREINSFQRHDSHLAPVLQYYKCPCPGTLTLIFDNKYSRMRSKKVSYRFTLTATEALEWLLDDDDDLRVYSHDGGGHSGGSGGGEDVGHSGTDDGAKTKGNAPGRRSDSSVASSNSNNTTSSGGGGGKDGGGGSSGGSTPVGRVGHSRTVSEIGLGERTSSGRPSPFGAGSSSDRLQKASSAIHELKKRDQENVALEEELETLKRMNDNNVVSLEDARSIIKEQEEKLKHLE